MVDALGNAPSESEDNGFHTTIVFTTLFSLWSGTYLQPIRLASVCSLHLFKISLKFGSVLPF